MNTRQLPSLAGPEADRWFVDHGLPWFVPERRDRARAALHSRHTLAGLAVVVLVALVAGVLLAMLTSELSLAPATLVTLVLLAALAYAGVRLGAWPIARWAARRTLGSLRLLFPMVTRALPLLLLFMTFLFINAEVWQVAATLDGGVLWVTVLLFGGIATGFLLVRLPEELDHVDGTEGARLDRLERANLLLVLMVAQALQVVLLAVSVFAFFLVFGAIVMTQGVQASWTGSSIHTLPWATNLSVELVQVSVFLAAFSGLYFTVTAVTDETYRGQFFTQVKAELERAIGARAVYLQQREDHASQPPPAPSPAQSPAESPGSPG